jgi:hypothetical protein
MYDFSCSALLINQYGQRYKYRIKFTNTQSLGLLPFAPPTMQVMTARKTGGLI